MQYSTKMRGILLCLICSLMLCGCNLEEDVSYLKEAEQDDIVSFLRLHEDTIRQEYEAWDGNVVEFDMTAETIVPIFENEYEVALNMNGRFLLDHITMNTYFYEAMDIMLSDTSVLQIVCMGYIDQNDMIYYDQYKIDGLLLSNQYNFLCLETEWVNTKEWMQFFSPTEFLFSLYDYSFEELANMGETFYFDSTPKMFTCKVEHSPQYLFEETLLEWDQMGEIFADEYLNEFGLDTDDVIAYLQSDESYSAMMDAIEALEYYTVYQFDKDGLCNAEIVQNIEYDYASMNTTFRVYPLNDRIHFDPDIYSKTKPFVDLSEYFDNVDWESIVSY